MKPKSASTPALVPRLHGRPSINQNSNMPSPIPFTQSEPHKGYKNLEQSTTSDSEEDLELSENVTLEKLSKPLFSENSSSTDSEDEANAAKNTSQSNEIRPTAKYQGSNVRYIKFQTEREIITTHRCQFNKQHGFCILAVLIAVIACWQFTIHALPEIPEISIDTLKESFPKEDKEFWLFIKSAVLEITSFDKPSIIVLMYKEDTSNYVNELLSSITKYASCILNKNCFVEPIVLLGKDLNADEIVQDYGVLIDRYKPLLLEKHIMVIKNMEQILGTVAQAFHYFCDEYTPLVQKSLIIFTIKVDEYKGREIQQVTNVLEEKWGDVHSEKLQALIARVSSVVLRIKQ